MRCPLSSGGFGSAWMGVLAIAKCSAHRVQVLFGFCSWALYVVNGCGGMSVVGVGFAHGPPVFVVEFVGFSGSRMGSRP